MNQFINDNYDFIKEKIDQLKPLYVYEVYNIVEAIFDGFRLEASLIESDYLKNVLYNELDRLDLNKITGHFTKILNLK